jgi:foldase protein PrsA
MRHVLVILTLLAGAGCAAPPQTGKPLTVAKPAPAAEAPPVAGPATDASAMGVMALIDGKPVRWSELRPLLVEAAGADVLGEWLLDRRLEATLRDKSMTVTEADVDAERQLMIRQFSDDPNEGVRLLNRLRDQRGLGPRRFPALLRRNASLRKLVADQVQVSDAMVAAAYEQRYGPKTVARMILVATLPEAAAVIHRLKAGESFTDLAINVSKDSSRDQGGLLPAISSEDASYPEAIRKTAARLAPGEVSDPVTLEQGFAILKCERKIEGEKTPLEKVAGELRQQVRLRAERSLMQRQARVLIEEGDATVLDNELDREWKQRRSQIVKPVDK